MSRIPVKTWGGLAAVWLIVIGFIAFGNSFLNGALTSATALIAFIILFITIIGAAFGVVEQADQLAYKLGEPYGTLILTLSIVTIEVILISAVMLSSAENPTIGKDSVFSVMMIIMNLIMGLAILLGGLKFGEQEYNTQGTISYLAMIALLGTTGMILPNFIVGAQTEAGAGFFSNSQAIFISLTIIVIYAIFLKFQTKEYRHLYVQPKTGSMAIPFKERDSISLSQSGTEGRGAFKKELWIRSTILILMIIPIVILSQSLAVVVDFGIKAANLPLQLGGLIIAIIVFTPESITAVKAALNNEFQRAINLCQGAFVSTAGLTIPSVLIIGLITGKRVLFGLTETERLLFVITLLLSILTFSGKRTTPMFGIMHLTLFAIFVMLIFNP